jgi:hypothetical protein
MRPFGSSLCFSTARADAITSHVPPSVICELLPAVTLPYLRSKNGFSFARLSGVESSRTPSSFCVERAVLRVQRDDFASEMALALRCEHAPVAARREFVHFTPRDVEAVREILRRLAHQQPDDRIGEALHEADDRCEVRRAKARQQRRALADALRRIPLRQPHHHRVGVRGAARATGRRRRRPARDSSGPRGCC